MKIKVPYRITNEVVAFEENQKITWRHLMKWTWSYELVDLGNGSTQVTEIFDASVCNKAQRWWVYKTDSLNRNPKWMAKSLVKLKIIMRGLITTRTAPALFVLLWSTGFTGIRYGIPYAPPFTFIAIRMAIASVLLALISLAITTPALNMI